VNVGVSDNVIVEIPLSPVVAVASILEPTKLRVATLPAVPTVLPSSLIVTPPNAPAAEETLPHSGAAPFQRRT